MEGGLVAGGRIRTLKPETLEDEFIARLSAEAFRLFVGCILLADDYGNLRGALEYLTGQIFWGAPADVPGALSELVRAEIIQPYEVRGQQYLHLRTWAQHQKVDHPGKPKVPAFSESLANPREGLAKVSEVLAPDLDLDQEGIRKGGESPPVLSAVRPVEVARLLSDHGKPRLVMPLDEPMTETRLPHLLERQLTAHVSTKKPTREDLEKLCRWLNSGVFFHGKGPVSAKTICQHLDEALDLSRAWDGKPLEAVKPISRHSPPVVEELPQEERQRRKALRAEAPQHLGELLKTIGPKAPE